MRLPSKKNRKVYSLYIKPEAFKEYKIVCDTHGINYGDSLEEVLKYICDKIRRGEIKPEVDYDDNTRIILPKQPKTIRSKK